MLDYRTAVSAYPRSFIGRYVAAAAGTLALVLFFQPWVVGNLPGIGSDHLRGVDLARGEASIRVDEASFGKARSAPARPASGTPGSGAGTPAGASGGTGAAGPANSAALGGLTLPTRVPTVAPGGTGFSAGAAATSASNASSAAANSAALGGLALPTRVPTVAPGASSGFSAPAPVATGVSTSSSAGAGINSGVVGATGGAGAIQSGTAAAAPAAPRRLPQVPLNGIPLASLGLAVFSVIWDRLHDQRDRLYGRIWTALLAAGGLWGTSYVLYAVTTAGQGNDLLGPGEAQGVLGALWGAAACFLVALISLLVAWSGPQPPPADPLAAIRGRRLTGVTTQPVST